MLNKKQADNLFKTIKGEARGEAIRVDWDYVNETWGQEGIIKLETRMKELGYPLRYEEIKAMAFYPLGLYNISLLSIKDVFKLDNEGIKKMGRSIVKFSLLNRIFFKYFISLKLIAKQVPAAWKKMYTVGDMDMPDFSEKKRYAVLRLRNFKDHPAHCLLTESYFAKFSQLVVRNPTTCKEVKCVFKGDSHHELLITW